MTDRVKRIIANAHIGAVDISELTAEEHGQLVRHIESTMPNFVTVDMKTLTDKPEPGTRFVNEIPLGPPMMCNLGQIRPVGEPMPRTREEAQTRIAKIAERVLPAIVTCIKPTAEQIAAHQMMLYRDAEKHGCPAGMHPTQRPYYLKALRGKDAEIQKEDNEQQPNSCLPTDSTE